MAILNSNDAEKMLLQIDNIFDGIEHQISDLILYQSTTFRRNKKK